MPSPPTRPAHHKLSYVSQSLLVVDRVVVCLSLRSVCTGPTTIRLAYAVRLPDGADGAKCANGADGAGTMTIHTIADRMRTRTRALTS